MGAIRLLKGETIVPSFDENGLSRVPLMPDANEEAKLFECALQKGKTWQPPLYGAGEKIQMFFFTAGSGYVTTETRAWNIAQGVFIPDYDREKVAIHAGTEEVRFLQIIGDLDDYDRMTMARYCVKFPRFRRFEDCVQYTEGFTGDAGSNVTSRLLLEGRHCGRWSMGWNHGIGPSFIGQHIHPHLLQWYYVLPDGFFTYLADGKEEDMGPGSLSYTEKNTWHGSKTDAGKNIIYIWLELAPDGYPEGPDGFPGL